LDKIIDDALLLERPPAVVVDDNHSLLRPPKASSSLLTTTIVVSTSFAHATVFVAPDPSLADPTRDNDDGVLRVRLPSDELGVSVVGVDEVDADRFALSVRVSVDLLSASDGPRATSSSSASASASSTDKG